MNEILKVSKNSYDKLINIETNFGLNIEISVLQTILGKKSIVSLYKLDMKPRCHLHTKKKYFFAVFVGLPKTDSGKFNKILKLQTFLSTSILKSI